MNLQVPNITTRGSSFRFISQVGQQRFVSHVSVPLVAEYESVLKRGQLVLTNEQVDDVIDYVCACAVHHKIFYLWRPTLKDAKDDLVLEH